MYSWDDFINDFPYTNFSDINVSWFLNKFKQIFDEWEGLYNQMLSWKETTDEYNANWREEQEQAFNTWETNFQNAIDAWKTQTETDINTWETDTIASLETWKAVFITQYNALKLEVEQIAEDAETAKNAAQLSAQNAANSADNASATALALQASLNQITANKNDISALNAELIYPTSKIVPVTQGYWAVANGEPSDSTTWCKTDYLYKDVIMKTTTIKMFLLAYNVDGTYIGAWNGTEFSTVFSQNAGLYNINIPEWLESYPDYRFRVDFNNGTNVITPADVYSILNVESDVYKNIERIDDNIEQVNDNIEHVEETTVDIYNELINKMAKQLIIDCLKNVAWTTPNGEDFIDELSYTLGIKNLLYSITKHYFDGSENSPINTGIILFDTDKDFTILLDIETQNVQVGDWAIIQGYSEADVSGLLIGKGYSQNITTNFRFMNKAGIASNVTFTSDYIGKMKIAIRHTSESNSAIFSVKTGTDEPVEITRTDATFITSNAPIYIGGSDTGRKFRGTISCNIYDVVMSDTLIDTFMEVGL